MTPGGVHNSRGALPVCYGGIEGRLTQGGYSGTGMAFSRWGERYGFCMRRLSDDRRLGRTADSSGSGGSHFTPGQCRQRGCIVLQLVKADLGASAAFGSSHAGGDAWNALTDSRLSEAGQGPAIRCGALSRYGRTVSPTRVAQLDCTAQRVFCLPLARRAPWRGKRALQASRLGHCVQ